MIEAAGPFVGIDFGTSTSSIACYDAESGRAEVIPDAVGEYKTPSLVLFGDDAVLVGPDAEVELRAATSEPDPECRAETLGRLVQGVKRRLVAPPVIPLHGGRTVRPVEVVAAVLRRMKADAEERHLFRTISRAVITCPAVFSRKEREVLRAGAAAAGFVEVELLEEPTAAALTFHRHGNQQSNTVLVYDLGAGTFDLSIVVRNDEGEYFTPIKPEGDPRCGGDDFDRALYEHCDKLALRDLDRTVSLTDDLDLAFLSQCRERKHNLTSKTSTRFSSLLVSAGAPVVFKHEITRAEFEDLIRPAVEETIRRTVDMVERCRDRGHQVNAVVLIGGSTKVPLVERLLEERLPVVPQKYANRDYAVALGAAYHAFALWGGAGQAGSPHDSTAEKYRQALIGCWADGRVTHSEVAWLTQLSTYDLDLPDEVSARLEREVLGDTLPVTLARQQAALDGHYDVALRMICDPDTAALLRAIPDREWHGLLGSAALFRSRVVEEAPSPQERSTVLGDTPWSAFVAAARLVRDLDLDDPGAEYRVRAVADELGLSPDEAGAVEQQVLGASISDHLQDRSRRAALDRERRERKNAQRRARDRARRARAKQSAEEERAAARKRTAALEEENKNQVRELMSREREKQQRVGESPATGSSDALKLARGRLVELARAVDSTPSRWNVLSSRLRAGEQPMVAMKCAVSSFSQDALLVVTNQRLLWVTQRWMSTDVVSIEAMALRSIQLKGQSLVVTNWGRPEKIKFRSTNKDMYGRVVTAVRALIP